MVIDLSITDLKSWLDTQPFLPTPAENVILGAISAWQDIEENPTSIAFKTSAGVAVAAQTVRLESDSRPTMSKAVSGQAPRRKVIIFGVYGHPTVADTNIKEGYTFNLSADPGDRYTVQDIVRNEGEIQAVAEAAR